VSCCILETSAKTNKTGRIRKVKCDEGRPACLRCVSTGRVCDGYGIWGGGGNFYGHRESSVVSKDGSITPWPPTGVSILAQNAEESRYFEWFKCRTSKKLAGPFRLTFWETLLFQASLNEPAILHAVLTLSSVHKKGVLDSTDQSRNADPPDEHEQFMLQHYLKAIHHLQPHFEARDKPAIRVALITCLVFVCIEFLRGHFETAQTHLDNGLKVFRELQIPSDVDHGVINLKSSAESTDDWLVEAFCRFHFQVELFKQTYRHTCTFVQPLASEPLITVFRFAREAWKILERLFNRIFYLTELCRKHRVSNHFSTELPSGLVRLHQRIQEELDQWLHTYEVSVKDMQGQDSDGFVRRILCEYHTMAGIMADASLRPDDESVFDSHTERFVFLTNQSAYMWKTRRSAHQDNPLPGRISSMARSIIDMGWIPPLYYTALKCRVHRIRLHAIKLLESACHIEGIWDSNVAACITRKVMEIEEKDFYPLTDAADDFTLCSSPEAHDLSLPTLPQANRIHEVKVILFDRPTDSVFFFYRQKQISAEWKEARVSIGSG